VISDRAFCANFPWITRGTASASLADGQEGLELSLDMDGMIALHVISRDNEYHILGCR
jgi:hypothetical protein